ARRPSETRTPPRPCRSTPRRAAGQDAATVPTPVVTPGGSADDTTVLRPVRDEERGRTSGESDAEVTAELPMPPVPPGAGSGEETEVLPPVPARPEDEIREPRTPSRTPSQAPSGASDETAVLPPVRPGDAEETAVLPPVRGHGPADRVPPGYFRDDAPAARDEAPAARPDGREDRTREMPQVDAEGTPRRRSDWAEETPLDDLPSLADELLGPHDDEPGEGRGRRGRGGRGR
ncbi:dTMP kinase, partial [Streptomyces sp. NPDC093509]